MEEIISAIAIHWLGTIIGVFIIYNLEIILFDMQGKQLTIRQALNASIKVLSISTMVIFLQWHFFFIVFIFFTFASLFCIAGSLTGKIFSKKYSGVWFGATIGAIISGFLFYVLFYFGLAIAQGNA